MSWPQHRAFIPGEGKEPALQFASKNPSENISFPFIEQVNKILPSLLNGVELFPAYVLTDQGPGQTPSQDPLEVVLDDQFINQQDVNLWGVWTTPGSVQVNLGLTYRKFMSCQTVQDLQKWYSMIAPQSDFAAFDARFLAEGRKNAEAQVINDLKAKLPTLG